MSNNSYIVDNPLPLSQDFTSLRQEGLAYVQQVSGTEWTNLNASDPGITILDQLCYALTELGYCNDFAIADILTSAEGKLEFDDQFYLPEDILTTAPVTPWDYVKYLVDGVTGVKNAVVQRGLVSRLLDINAYDIRLLVDSAITDPDKIKKICLAAYYYLVASRNIGEIFGKPKHLKSAIHFITGTIAITNKTELDDILSAITSAISNYIFPSITQSGYQQLTQDGLDTNQVFNGPLLQNGWIPDTEDQKKKDKLSTIGLINMISAIPGVQSVSGILFDNAVPPCTQISCYPDQVLVIDLDKSLQSGLEIYCQDELIAGINKLNPIIIPQKPKPAATNIQLGAAVKVQTNVPQGNYRDINSYYSIQNTFPEAYAVGIDATTANASNFQIAQSRQLKGYLTLFDQVLANQFSQLANLGKLFSFKNSMTGTPSDQYQFYAVKDRYEKKHPEYPVPYLAFAPTYYYQSLYDVPHIRPLLKDHNIFKFGDAHESKKKLSQKSWEEYKLDPYNPYIHGLMKFVEDEKDGLQRRNAILDHLLARHGESVVMFDAFIKGSVYTGDTLKDKIIFKSIYLQNLGLLSYYRQKGYNYLAAARLQGKIRKVPADHEKRILGGYVKDFICNARQIDRIEALTQQDFVNYSATELKLNMLLGLKAVYNDFIAENYDNPASQPEIDLAFWMICERKGLFFIETDLLLKFLAFDIIVAEDPQDGPFWQISEHVDYEQLLAVLDHIQSNPAPNLNDQLHQQKMSIGDAAFTLMPAANAGTANKHYKWIAQTDYFYTVRIRSGNEIADTNNLKLFDIKLELIFPGFMPQLNTKAFQNRLEFFLQNTLPVQLSYRHHFIEKDELFLLIELFTLWYNSIRYHGHIPLGAARQAEAAGKFYTYLTTLKPIQA